MFLKVKKRFVDFPLLQKIVVSLIVMVILPMIVVTTFLAVWLYRTDTENLYKRNYEQLNFGMSDLKIALDLAEALPADCVSSDLFMRFAEEKQAGRDYMNFRDWLDDLYQKSSVYENITISFPYSRNFEAGNYVAETTDEVYGKLGERTGQWEYTDTTNYGYPGLNKNQKNLLVYYGKIVDYTPSRMGREYGTVSARLRETDLCSLYSQRFSTQYDSVFYADQDGKIISSTDKQVLGSQWKLFSDFQKRRKDRADGLYRKNGMVYMYVADTSRDYYLIEAVRMGIFYRDIRVLFWVFTIALVLCLLFGIIFGLVQRHYIVTPVYELKAALGSVEKGDFLSVSYRGRKDEIGVLQKSFNHMSDKLNNLVNRVYRADAEKKEAELRALTEQIKPHFLYNTLDSIHWKAIRNRDAQVAEQIMALSDVYRYLLNKGNEFLAIKDELDFLDRYLYLMNMRFGGRVTWKPVIEEGIGEILLPKLLIQPLVENALVHGLEPAQEGGKIILTIKSVTDGLLIVVEDTGVGFGRDLDLKNEEIDSLEGSFALKNIHNRLKIHYPNAYEYRIQSAEDGGSRVSIQIYFESDAV